VRKIEVAVSLSRTKVIAMKKLVPDPPRRPINTPFFTPESDLYQPLALAHVIELLRGKEEE
jgi:hypothetical protein